MQKASTMMLYIVVKILGLLIVAGILLTFLFPKERNTTIVVDGTLLNHSGEVMAQKPFVFYSGIYKGTCQYSQAVTTDKAGRFEAQFQKEYTITLLKTYLKLQQMADPPFYFAIRLENDDPTSPYYIIAVTPKTATIETFPGTKGAAPQSKISPELQVSANLKRQGANWVIQAVIRGNYQ